MGNEGVWADLSDDPLTRDLRAFYGPPPTFRYVKGPRHLWTGDWRTASHENDEALAEHEALAPPPEDPLAEPVASNGNAAAAAATDERGGRSRSTLFAVGLAISIIAAGGLF